MTKPRDWPNKADWARMDNIADGTRLLSIARPLIYDTENLSHLEISRIGNRISEISAKLIQRNYFVFLCS